MARRNKTLTHHKRAHNGKHRARKGEVFQARPKPVYRRPCGCTIDEVAPKNELMMSVILRTRPTMAWGTEGWELLVPEHIHKKFRLCLKHLPKDVLEAKGVKL